VGYGRTRLYASTSAGPNEPKQTALDVPRNTGTNGEKETAANSRDQGRHDYLDDGVLFGNIQVVMGRRRAVERLPLVPISAILASVAVITVVLNVAITVPCIWAPGPVAIASAVTIIVAVAVPAIILTRRIITGAAPGRRGPTTTRRTRSATITVTTRLKPPRSRRRSACPLDLQDIVTADALVVHLVISIVRIAAILILDKRKESARRRARSGNIATD